MVGAVEDLLAGGMVVGDEAVVDDEGDEAGGADAARTSSVSCDPPAPGPLRTMAGPCQR